MPRLAACQRYGRVYARTVAAGRKARGRRAIDLLIAATALAAEAGPGSRTTVKLPDELDARLRHEAQRRGMTISELTRAAIEAHVGSGPRRRLGAAAGGSERTGRRLRAHRGDHCRGGSAIALIIDSGPLYAYVDAEVRFLGGLAVGSFRLELVHPSDLIGMAELVAATATCHSAASTRRSSPPPNGAASWRSQRSIIHTSGSSARSTPRRCGCCPDSAAGKVARVRSAVPDRTLTPPAYRSRTSDRRRSARRADPSRGTRLPSPARSAAHRCRAVSA